MGSSFLSLDRENLHGERGSIHVVDSGLFGAFAHNRNCERTVSADFAFQDRGVLGDDCVPLGLVTIDGDGHDRSNDDFPLLVVRDDSVLKLHPNPAELFLKDSFLLVELEALQGDQELVFEYTSFEILSGLIHLRNRPLDFGLASTQPLNLREAHLLTQGNTS